jgi:trk system potassium uptake protein TrkH
MAPVLRALGFILHIPAAMALLSAGICLAFDEMAGLPGFGATLLVGLLLGQSLLMLTRKAGPIEQRHALLVAALAWLVVPLVTTIPFLATPRILGPEPGAAGVFLRFDNALFEALSGITSTGLSVVPQPSGLPRHLQWWRSFSEWVGGIGVVVLLLAVLPPDRSALYLFFAEGREEKILPTVKSTVRAIWGIFLVFTGVGFLLLWAAGEPPWQALNHAMTAIATGGFTITDDSLAASGSAAKAVYLLLMIAGAVSFLLHYRLLREGATSAVLAGTETRFFGVVLAAGAGILALENLRQAPPIGLLDSTLQWVSALTTTGFSSTPLAAWSAAPLLWLVLAMLMGAMAGSTGSGIKQRRVALLLASIGWNIQSLRRTPREVATYPFDRRRLPEEEAAHLIRTATTMAAAYLLVWLAGVFALLHLGPENAPLGHVLFEAASAQGNVGLSAGLTGPDLGRGAKGVLMALMWAGRLEIFPVLLLAAYVLGRR